MGRKRRACARLGRVSVVLGVVIGAVYGRGWIRTNYVGVSLSNKPDGTGSSRTDLSNSRVPTFGNENFGTPTGETHREGTSDEPRHGQHENAQVTDATMSSNVQPSSKKTHHAGMLWKQHTTESIGDDENENKLVYALDNVGRSNRYGYPPNAALSATFATIDVVVLLHNWLEHAKSSNLPNIVVIALDEEVIQWCLERNVKTLNATKLIDSNSLVTDSKQLLIGHREHKDVFNKIGMVKTKTLLELLTVGLNVLISDVDVVWLNSPARYFQSGQTKRAHILVSSDCVFSFEPGRSETDKFGQKPDPRNAEFNTGVLLLRATTQSIDLVTRWLTSQSQSNDKEMNDQSHFNKVIHFGGSGRAPLEFYEFDETLDGAIKAIATGKSTVGDAQVSFTYSDINSMRTPDWKLFPEEYKKGLRPRLYECGNIKTRVGLLPTGLFSNGHTYFVSRVGERQGVSPFAVHNTYQYSGTSGKIARFRENAGMWALDGAAYFGEGSFDGESLKKSDATLKGDTVTSPVKTEKRRRFLYLSYDIPRHLADINNSLATPKGATPLTHVELVKYQVNRIRDGLLLASQLDRILILPPILCTCDRWFNLLPNCTQGDLQIPLVCPLDHVFLVFALDKFDGGGRYAESAFFENRVLWLEKNMKRLMGKQSEGNNVKHDTAVESSATDVNGVASSTHGRYSSTVPPLGPVARLVFEQDKKESSKKLSGFKIPEDMSALPGFSQIDSATAEAIADVYKGSPRYSVTKFGSSVRDVNKALGPALMADAQLLVVENLSPNAFTGFDDTKRNEQFYEKILPVMHEWCCRKNGTVPHLPTRYGVKEVVHEYEVSLE